MKECIEVGDVVDVFFEHVGSEIKCEVIYKPTSFGDSWCLKKVDGGGLVNVMVYSKMVKYENLKDIKVGGTD